MRKFILLTILCLLISPSLLSADAQVVSSMEEIDDIDILVLVSNDCGWSYFVVNETLQDMGANVITMTNNDSLTVTTCPNKEPRPFTADFMLSEFDLESISEYDGIIIPAGGQWRHLSDDSAVHELLQVAYESGLVIGSICNGGITLGKSDVVPNGTKIVNPLPDVVADLLARGAEFVWGAWTVSDNRIVTGDIGEVYQSGGETAPTYEVCFEVVKTILGVSAVSSCEVVQNTEGDNLDFIVSVEIADLAQEFPGFNTSDVEEVTAYIRSESNSSDITEVDLAQVQGTGQYRASFAVPRTGRYIVNLDIMKEDYNLEVVRDAATFSTDTPLGSLMILAGVAGTIVVVAIAVIFLKKRS